MVHFSGSSMKAFLNILVTLVNYGFYKLVAALLNHHRTDSVVGVALSRSLGDKLARPVSRRFREKLRGSWAGARTLSHSDRDVLTTFDLCIVLLSHIKSLGISKILNNYPSTAKTYKRKADDKALKWGPGVGLLSQICCQSYKIPTSKKYMCNSKYSKY